MQAFEQSLIKRGWKREFPRGLSIDRCYFIKDGERLERKGSKTTIYFYSGVTVEVEPDGRVDLERGKGSEPKYVVDVLHGVLAAQRAQVI